MIFFHVGLHKTGTTFLQKEVFPKWQGVTYVPWPHLELFLRMKSKETYLVSREGLSGQNWAHHEERERSIKRLSEMFPQARILISFRQHSGYIVSSYRQYLLRGGTREFVDYFDLEADAGLMKRDDFVYRKKLDAIERYFGHRPFVFLHEELSRGFGNLLNDLERYVGGRAPSPDKVDHKRHNVGVGYYPGKLLRHWNTFLKTELNPNGKYNLNRYYLRKLRLTPPLFCQYWLSFIPNRPFLTPDSKTEIDDFYASDWDYVNNYARTRLTSAGRSLD